MKKEKEYELVLRISAAWQTAYEMEGEREAQGKSFIPPKDLDRIMFFLENFIY